MDGAGRRPTLGECRRPPAITIVGPAHGAARQPYVPCGRAAVGRSADSRAPTHPPTLNIVDRHLPRTPHVRRLITVSGLFAFVLTWLADITVVRSDSMTFGTVWLPVVASGP
ncbi:hypothetical protein SVIO_004510 [Streptomyces violaceusniger]|uniref:Uncharacterized protein n=1 Tax=Streptomyces violaceusniger TaxID=68280 RepID=A0A4D4KTV6_STRVO|nr:hypothetical protein SVIO_004510 [Streptomyces violaceusniger]